MLGLLKVNIKLIDYTIQFSLNAIQLVNNNLTFLSAGILLYFLERA
jgi:hypothetical protein